MFILYALFKGGSPLAGMKISVMIFPCTSSDYRSHGCFFMSVDFFPDINDVNRITGRSFLFVLPAKIFL